MSKPRPAISTLPDTTQARIPLLVERSAPDADRPRQSAEIERRLEAIDRRHAACYAALEDAAARYADFATKISECTKKKP
jgi:hypothetical protein